MGAMDDLLGPRQIAELCESLERADPDRGFDALLETSVRLGPLPLRGRTDVAAHALAGIFPEYSEAAEAFRTALKDPAFRSWALWPVTEAAVTLALRQGGNQAFDDCLDLLAELTPRLTSEFAIRRLLRADLDRALTRIQAWTADADPHVRRLASEGTRPYLPWAVRVAGLIERPGATVPILDSLRNDPSGYVRRSVANHLNDLARHAPEMVLGLASQWQDSGTPESAWITRRGLRTLVKKANPDALALMGFRPAEVAVEGPNSETGQLTLPAVLSFDCVLTNKSAAPARLAVDYVVHYVKASGSTAPKVFKLAVLELDPGESRQLSGRHAFRQMTTRRHYAGVHHLELQVNGIRHGRLEFEVSL
ncbi:DNA alkylation repair protein [Arthrobacter sp. Sa2BUA2]|uniref:DNA alkylation repair protein n=1 Tax=Arthrobacter pullicola TaxID=2762224 RepID=A0ABR8YHV8_9MICC|nr:DNA alkylation repair protein [Arthrobacter pullicola]MBD8043813.1 DNA alkylation repair protein [Arthrobacter pullicola]